MTHKTLIFILVMAGSVGHAQPYEPVRTTTNDLSVFESDTYLSSLVGKTQIWEFKDTDLTLETICEKDQACPKQELPYLENCKIKHKPIWAAPLPPNTDTKICDNFRHWINQDTWLETSKAKSRGTFTVNITTYHGVAYSIEAHIHYQNSNETAVIREVSGPALATFIVESPEHLFQRFLKKLKDH